MAFDPLPGPPKDTRFLRDYSGIGLEVWRQVQPAADPPPKPAPTGGVKSKITRKEFDAMSPLRRHQVATSGRFEFVD